MAAPPPALALAPPPGAEQGRFDDPQQQHQQHQQQQLSPEEVKVLRECQSESFWRRSLPLSGLLGAAAHLAVQRGVLRPSPSYGAKPKVVLGIIVGYFAGKFSYATVCSEKFLSQAPDSPLADAVRRRRGLPMRHPELQQQQEEPGFSLPPAPGNNGGPALQQLRQQQEAHRLQLQEANRLQEVREQQEQGDESLSGYEELRRRNRAGPPAAPPAPPEQGLYQQLGLPPAPPASGGGAQNKYGDEGFE